MSKRIKLIIYAIILSVILFLIGMIIGIISYHILSANDILNVSNSSADNISNIQSINTNNKNSSVSTLQDTTKDNSATTVTNTDNTNTPSKNILSIGTYRANATINSNKANLYYNPNSDSQIIPGGEYLGHGRQIEVLKQNVDGTNYDEVIVTISSVPYKGYVYSNWITMSLNT